MEPTRNQGGPIGLPPPALLSRTVYVGLGATGKSLYERTTTPGAPTKHVHFIYRWRGPPAETPSLPPDPGRQRLGDGPVLQLRIHLGLGHRDERRPRAGREHPEDVEYLDATVLGYDAWGARRNPDGTAASPASFDIPVGNRGIHGTRADPGRWSLVNILNVVGSTTRRLAASCRRTRIFRSSRICRATTATATSRTTHCGTRIRRGTSGEQLRCIFREPV